MSSANTVSSGTTPLMEFSAPYSKQIQPSLKPSSICMRGDLVADGFDIAFRFGQPKSSTLVARKIFDTRILTVCAPSYLVRYGRPQEPSELTTSRHVCIQFRDPETTRPFDWEFHRDGKVLRVATAGQLTLTDVGTMHGILCAGHGIAQVMALGVAHLLQNQALVELFPDWNEERFPLYALYPSRKLLPARVSAFLDFVLELSRAASTG